MEKISYAFLSKLIPNEMYDEVSKNAKRNMMDAANALQWHLYNGLCKNIGEPITLINVLPVHSWPQYYKKAFISKKVFETGFNYKNTSVGFCNVKGIRNYSKIVNIYKALSEWCAQNEGKKVLFVYTMSSAYLTAISVIKKLYKNLFVCVIVADLPDMCNLSTKKDMITKIVGNMNARNSYKLMNNIDAYVLLTKHMAEYMNLDKPWCVVEGISTEAEAFDLVCEKKENEKVIFYAGTLHERFGVWNLVEAFKKIEEKDFRLILCGVGDCENEIVNASKDDERIVFMGQLPRAEVLKLQKKATVVVNPRQNIEEFTKYSFPSKNLEYLSSGVPMVAYKLDGIPDEYDSYIFYVEDNSVEALKNKLLEVCNMQEELLAKKAEAARQFVLENKNESVQTKKIFDFINKLL